APSCGRGTPSASEDFMRTQVAVALLPSLVLACHSSSKTPPGSGSVEHAAPVAHDDKDRKDRDDKDDDDDDEKGGGAGGQNALPAKPTPAPAATGPARTLSFDADKADSAPAGFSFGRTGKGAAGKWLVKAEPGA